MEISDIFLTLVGLVIAMLGWFMSRLADTVNKLEQSMTSCQTNMPINYVLKADYKTEMSELKGMIGSQSRKIDQIWKHMRIDK
jgi:lipopolysaccharide biosynthesis regulator YciM